MTRKLAPLKGVAALAAGVLLATPALAAIVGEPVILEPTGGAQDTTQGAPEQTQSQPATAAREVVLEWRHPDEPPRAEIDFNLFDDPVMVPGDQSQSTVRVRNEGPTTGTLVATLVDATAAAEPLADIYGDRYQAITVNGLPVAQALDSADGVVVSEGITIPAGGYVDLPFVIAFDAIGAPQNVGNSAMAGEREAHFALQFDISGEIPAATLQVTGEWLVTNGANGSSTVYEWTMGDADAPSGFTASLWQGEAVNEPRAWDAVTAHQMRDVIYLSQNVELPPLCTLVDAVVLDWRGEANTPFPTEPNVPARAFELSTAENQVTVRNIVNCETLFTVYTSALGPAVDAETALNGDHPATGFVPNLDYWPIELGEVTEDGVQVFAWSEGGNGNGNGEEDGGVEGFASRSTNQNEVEQYAVVKAQVNPGELLVTSLDDVTPQFHLAGDPDPLADPRVSELDLQGEALTQLLDLAKGELRCWYTDEFDLEVVVPHTGAPLADGSNGVVQAPLGYHTMCEKVAETSRLAVAKVATDGEGNRIDISDGAWEIQVLAVDSDGNPLPGRDQVLRVDSEDRMNLYFRVEPERDYLVTLVPSEESSGFEVDDVYLAYETRVDLLRRGGVARVDTLELMQHGNDSGSTPNTTPNPWRQVRVGDDIRIREVPFARSLGSQVIVNLNAVEMGTVVFHSTQATTPQPPQPSPQPTPPTDPGPGAPGPGEPGPGQPGQPGSGGQHPVTGVHLALLLVAAVLALGGGLIAVPRVVGRGTGGAAGPAGCRTRS